MDKLQTVPASNRQVHLCPNESPSPLTQKLTETKSQRTPNSSFAPHTKLNTWWCQPLGTKMTWPGPWMTSNLLSLTLSASGYLLQWPESSIVTSYTRFPNLSFKQASQPEIDIHIYVSFYWCSLCTLKPQSSGHLWDQWKLVFYWGGLYIGSDYRTTLHIGTDQMRF